MDNKVTKKSRSLREDGNIIADSGSSPRKSSQSPSKSTVKKVEASTVNTGDSKPKITLFTHPIKTITIFIIILLKYLQEVLRFILRHAILFTIIILAIVLPHVIVDGPHKEYVKIMDEFVSFTIYWILLGVASSIGLGTGLHTFVLYTGPHIAKVTMVANECNTIPDYLPSRWNLERFDECPAGDRAQISFWTILLAVQLESFLWGLGTAIGELPPYFVARAASIAGKTSEELEELKKGESHGIIDRIKLIIYKNLHRHGFLTVLLCASIPNPLFDLAGITCGHFGIPFRTFFTSTFIGKAIVKVHLQMLFVIFVFTAHHVESLLSFVEGTFPFFRHSLSQFLAAQKKQLHSPKISGDKPIIQVVWDYVILAMIIFFAVSIINSLVANYLEEEENKKESGKTSESKKKD